jgi:hypothetical protein
VSLTDLIRYALVFSHIIGLAAIVGSYILQMPWRRGFDFLPLVIGSAVTVVTGCALIAVREIGDLDVIELKMVTKLGLALIVAAVSVIGLVRSRRLARSDAVDAALKPLLMGAGVLAMVNVAVALFWR